MLLKYSLFIFVLALTACQSSLPLSTPTSIKAVDTGTPSRTPIPVTSTATQTSARTATHLPPTRTVDQSLAPTLTPTSKPTQATKSPGPGLIVRGTVKLADGTAVEGVDIHVAFASYDGSVVATTSSSGYYTSEYIYIPGDETIRVWAEAAGFSFKPADGTAVWTGTEFYWRHYFGFEDRSLDFTAISEPVVK
ncbi:MAG: carboxypeptidase-like regulatory domain-containing protein [Anaerolineales bacterium]|nr:carboxypeptidase-like regulatory domain-containing protein [Anaerolineales bacterium]